MVYDKLTINECQKNDVQFVKVLDKVRCGYPSSNVIECLKSIVIEGTIGDNCVNPVMFQFVCFLLARLVQSSIWKC